MIYCQLNNRVRLLPGAPLTLGQIARVASPADLSGLPIPCPDRQGVWRITPADILPLLQSACPGEDVTFLGADACYVHRIRRRPAPLRTAAAFLILMLGSALGLAWFHSDVDMPQAQLSVYRAITGEAPADPRLITWPYIIGVAAGVCVFYALPSRSRSTPMEVKLNAYLESMEETEGKDIHDA